MRLGATSPMIWIDDENEAVNWLWYCSPAYRDEAYVPAARARPAGDAPAAAQWRAWQEQLWAGVRRDPSRFRRACPPLGDDPPPSVSLSRWPALQAYCQAAWPTFPEWFRMARLTMISRAVAAHLHRAVRQAIRVMGVISRCACRSWRSPWSVPWSRSRAGQSQRGLPAYRRPLRSLAERVRRPKPFLKGKGPSESGAAQPEGSALSSIAGTRPWGRCREPDAIATRRTAAWRQRRGHSRGATTTRRTGGLHAPPAGPSQ